MTHMTVRQDPHSPPRPSLTGVDCPACGGPMTLDQRYCLACGERNGGRRVPLPAPPGSVVTAASPVPPPTAARMTSPSTAWAGGVGLLLLAMGVGVLMGRAGDEPPQRSSAAPPITVVQSGAASEPVAATSGGATAFTADWPAGESGWTVALQQLPKEGTTAAQVAQAKADAVAKGAADAGALDTDAYGSLEPGAYLVYAGRFRSSKQAAAALRKLKASFPDARVVEVAEGGAAAAPAKAAAKPGKAAKKIEELDNLSPEQYQKKSKALPNEVGTEGPPPPKDDKPAGGGSDFEEIG